MSIIAVPAAACIAAEVPRVPGVELRAAIKTFDPRRSSQQFRHYLVKVWGYLVGEKGGYEGRASILGQGGRRKER